MPDASSSPPPEKSSPRQHRLWLSALKIVVMAVVLGGIYNTVANAMDDLRDEKWSPKRLRYDLLAAAGGVYLLGLTPAGVFWWQVLRRFGQHPGALETLRAYFIGHLGKYVPGKALVVILRAGLISGHHVSTRLAAAAVFCETLTMMAVGAFVGGGVVLLRFPKESWLAALAVGLMLAAGLPTIPPVFARLARLAGVGRNAPEIADRLEHLDYRTLASGWLLNLAGWMIVGTSLLLTVKAVGFAHADRLSQEWLVCVGAAALAMVAGFASLIPGGLGVRDAVLLVLLAPTFGRAGALVATIVARLVWLVAEVLISIILYLLGAKPKRRSHLPDGTY